MDSDVRGQLWHEFSVYMKNEFHIAIIRVILSKRLMKKEYNKQVWDERT